MKKKVYKKSYFKNLKLDITSLKELLVPLNLSYSPWLLGSTLHAATNSCVRWLSTAAQSARAGPSTRPPYLQSQFWNFFHKIERTERGKQLLTLPRRTQDDGLLTRTWESSNGTQFKVYVLPVPLRHKGSMARVHQGWGPLTEPTPPNQVGNLGIHSNLKNTGSPSLLGRLICH